MAVIEAEHRAPAPTPAPPPRGRADGDYGITLDPAGKRIRAVFDGVTVADSSRALILRESRYPPVYYFPRADVRMDLMRRTAHHTYCPFKGTASYWTVETGGRRAENAVWSYEDPIREVARIKDLVAFYWDRMDAWYEDEDALFARVEGAEPAANPLVDWLLREGWDAATTAELVGRFGRAITEAGTPLMRLNLVVRTLHPLLWGTAYSWRRAEDKVAEYRPTYEMLTDPAYLESPLAPIIAGAGGVRRWLEGPDPELDYPILRELREQGATDYVAMPLAFSDGQINVITLTSDRPGGFSTAELGHIHEVLPTLSRVVEAQALRQTATAVIGTYLGAQTGQKVLEGSIKRGDGEDIHAVVWYCDLRGSTPLAESMPRAEFLAALNQFLDCTAGAVLAQGGEVLRIIGDCVLAIFPIDEGDGKVCCRAGACSAAEACERALAAALDARRRLAETNLAREAAARPALDFGVSLHVGDVTYGNIGTRDRLEFTVIGPAANEAARIEDMCKTLGRPILASAAFAERYPGRLESAGRHDLRGVSGARELFAPPAGG